MKWNQSIRADNLDINNDILLCRHIGVKMMSQIADNATVHQRSALLVTDGFPFKRQSDDAITGFPDILVSRVLSEKWQYRNIYTWDNQIFAQI